MKREAQAAAQAAAKGEWRAGLSAGMLLTRI